MSVEASKGRVKPPDNRAKPPEARGTGLAPSRSVADPQISGVRRSPTAPERPVQDEWGIYDPEQAGFEAILRKLEMADDDDGRDPPPPSGADDK